MVFRDLICEAVAKIQGRPMAPFAISTEAVASRRNVMGVEADNGEAESGHDAIQLSRPGFAEARFDHHECLNEVRRSDRGLTIFKNDFPEGGVFGFVEAKSEECRAVDNDQSK